MLNRIATTLGLTVVGFAASALLATPSAFARNGGGGGGHGGGGGGHGGGGGGHSGGGAAHSGGGGGGAHAAGASYAGGHSVYGGASFGGPAGHAGVGPQARNIPPGHSGPVQGPGGYHGGYYHGGYYGPRPAWYGYGYGYGYGYPYGGIGIYEGNSGYYADGGYSARPMAPQPPLSRFGIGVYGGAVGVQGTDGSTPTTTGSDYGFIARLRLTPGWSIEGEIGKSQYTDSSATSSTVGETRMDRRYGASLLYEFGAYNTLAPYIVGGVGETVSDVSNGTSADRAFGEIGLGLRYRIAPHIEIAADIRAGHSQGANSNSPTVFAASTSSNLIPDGNGEDYTRGRISAILTF